MDHALPHGKESQPPAKPAKGRHIGRFLAIVAACLVVIAILGFLSRWNNTRSLQAAVDSREAEVVNVVHPSKIPPTVALELPGQTQAYIQAPIYAQVSGYLKKWYYDIGAKVKSGDVLAEIDTPALDQQLSQAQATLRQSQAQQWLSQATYQRGADLLKTQVISQQDFDNQSGDLKAKMATVGADEANVRQLQALEAFKLLRAPFDGIVSARNTDIGALVTSGSGTPLFTVAQVSPLRVYVSVPESKAPYVKAGTQADLTFDSDPGRKFPAEVVTTAGAIDPGTRTLLTELQVPNKDEALFPGAYVKAHFEVQGDPKALLVPANVLLFRSEGPAVGVVGQDGKVQIKSVRVAQDLGTNLEVEGLSPDDQVIVNPSDSLSDGAVVQILKSGTGGGKAPAPGQG
jgi:RND family efflux transporter MFP subunit